MSERIVHVPAQEPEHDFGWKTWQVLKVVQARLRFVAILAAVGCVIGFWDNISNYYEKWTRPLYGQKTEASSEFEYFCPMHPSIVRDDNKEKCPICHMDLAKRKRGTGEPEPLPPGTVSRVQLTPYRIVLAGVQTTAVRYRTLARQIATFGSVEFNETTLTHIATRQKGRIVKQFANYTGQEVMAGEKLALLDVRYDRELMVTLEDLRRARRSQDNEMERDARLRLRQWDVSDAQIKEFLGSDKIRSEVTIFAPEKGHIIKRYQREGSFVEDGTPLYDLANLDSVWIEGQVYETDQRLLKEGQPVQAKTLAGEVFAGTLDFIYPHLDESSRTLTVRFHIPNQGHRLRPGAYATVTIDVPPARINALSRAVALDTAGENAVDHLAHILAAPGGASAGAGVLALLRGAERQVRLQFGQVLAVPDSAVIDTGRLQIVYRESAPGIYEGVSVQLGPRLAEAGDTLAWYPVLHGLEEGETVVTNGSFLIDAETRLNPAAGSIYFSGSGGKGSSSAVAVRPSTPEDEDATEKKVRAELAKLSAADRRLAESQKFCPVLRKNRLGDMGPPFKVTIEGQPVFLCCGSCEEKAKADPKKTLEIVEQLKRGSSKPAIPAPAGESPSEEEKEIRDNLTQLGNDRPLAEAQRYCPIRPTSRLGSMGAPFKLTIEGQMVFLCCGSCETKAKANPAKTLATVKELKAKAASKPK
jgi:Cu(I)/Ag(I) efflux system membrane fusion protein